MAETNGYPSQDDINDIWNSQVDYICKCSCCPEDNDTDDPRNEIQQPENNSVIPSSVVTIIGNANDGFDGSAIGLG